MKRRTGRLVQVGVAIGLTILLSAINANAQSAAESSTSSKPTIILVHGAFADGSGWSHVIPVLEKDGYNVIAVQNPLASYDNDVATTRRVIDAQKGPVVVVGHSYGGAVITGAAFGAKNVKALVYVAAFAPDSAEVVGPLVEKYPSAASAAFVPDAAGFIYIDRAKFKEVFAKDVPEPEVSVMAAAQKPVHGSTFGQVFGAAAWKSLPTWFVIPTEDQVINPDLQRMFAKRMKAKVTEVASSHVPFISHPDVVVKVIEEAAATK